jgi:hypothetical protein
VKTTVYYQFDQALIFNDCIQFACANLDPVQDLRQAKMAVMNYSQCNQYWSPNFKPDSQLCAGYGNDNIAMCNVSGRHSVTTVK